MVFRLTQKALQLSFYYFFSFSSVFLDGIWKVFYLYFKDCYPRRVWLVLESFHWTHWNKVVWKCSVDLKFCLWERDVPCALDKMIKQGYNGHQYPTSAKYRIMLPYLQECSYIHYHSAYDHQSWQDGH